MSTVGGISQASISAPAAIAFAGWTAVIGSLVLLLVGSVLVRGRTSAAGKTEPAILPDRPWSMVFSIAWATPPWIAFVAWLVTREIEVALFWGLAALSAGLWAASSAALISGIRRLRYRNRSDHFNRA